jgi:ATP-dependent helicase/nuclease subunit A
MPSWTGTPVPAEPRIRIPLAPSRLAPLETDASGEPQEARKRASEPPILPPAALAEDYRFLRGTITHALLEHLPSVPSAGWQAAAESFVASRGARLAADVRVSIVGEVLAVLRDPQFAALFGPDSRAEVAIAGEIAHPTGAGPALRVNGKIDRLAREGNTILIVDYKTNRPPPRDPAQVAEAYLLQLAAYRMAVMQIFPGLAVRAAILWTDGARIMEITGQRLDEYQQRLWARDSAYLDG